MLVVKGKPFDLVDVGRQVKGYDPRPGDYFLRTMTPDELHEVAEIRLKTIRKDHARRGLATTNTAKLRAQLRVSFADTLIVSQVDPSHPKKA